jgi:hypothetical protein
MKVKAILAERAIGQAFCFKSRHRHQRFQGLIHMDISHHLKKRRRSQSETLRRALE